MATGANGARLVKSISVIIPVFQSSDCLEELHRRLVAVLTTLTTNFEIILVEDDGRNLCWPGILKIAKQDSRVRGIRFSRNFGQHHAITAGLDHCSGEWVVVMDGDLQDPPEAIPLLLEKALEGHAVVFARRTDRAIGAGQRFTSWAFYWMLRLVSRVKLDPSITNFSIISRKVVATLRGMRENMRFYGGMIIWAGFDFATVDYPQPVRFSGKSSYSFYKRLRLAARNTFAYSNIPLIYSTFVGVLFSFFALVMAAYLLVLYFAVGTAPEGWTMIAVAIFLIGGFIIFQVGISGIYLGEVFNEVRRRPIYVINELVGFDSRNPLELSDRAEERKNHVGDGG